MQLSHSIEELLALAAETSPVDVEALDLLGRRLLSAVIHDSETPETLKKAAARLLRKSENVPSSAEVRTSEDTPD
jgi:uncharacterized protein (UPF0147 family)